MVLAVDMSHRNDSIAYGPDSGDLLESQDDYHRLMTPIAGTTDSIDRDNNVYQDLHIPDGNVTRSSIKPQEPSADFPGTDWERTLT